MDKPDRPKSFKPYKRVEKSDGVHLEDPVTGKSHKLIHAVTDEADGITDADFDFKSGARWAKAHADDD